MINKNKFHKTNDKKILHKVRKSWVVLSLSLLMLIGGGIALTHTSVNADSTTTQAPIEHNLGTPDPASTTYNNVTVTGTWSKYHYSKNVYSFTDPHFTLLNNKDEAKTQTFNFANNELTAYNSQFPQLPNTKYYSIGYSYELNTASSSNSINFSYTITDKSDPINFVNKNTNTSVGSGSYTNVEDGSPLTASTTGALSNYKIVPDVSNPQTYSLSDNTATFTATGNPHTIYVLPKDEESTNVTNYVEYVGTTHHQIKVATPITGAKDTSAKSAIDSNLPTHYSVVDSSDNVNFNTTNTSTTNPFIVTIEKHDTDTIEFNGDTDSSAHQTVHGIDNKPSTVSAPTGYHYINGSTGSFTFNNGNHTFDVAKNEVATDNNVIAYSNGTNKTINDVTNGASAKNDIDANVPSGYHVVSDSDNQNFGPDASTLNVTVAPNTDTDSIVFNGDSEASGHITKTGDNSSTSHVDAPTNYHFINGSTGDFTFNNGTHTFDVAKDIPAPSVPSNTSFVPSTPTVESTTNNTPTTITQPTTSKDVEITEAPIKLLSIKNVHQLNKLSVGKPSTYHGNKIIRLKPHFKYFWLVHGLVLHTDPIYSKKNGKKALVIKKHLTVPIVKVFKIHYHHATRIRYEVKYNHHYYFVTGNTHFTQNSYWQKNDLKHKHSMTIRVYRPCVEYKSSKYNKHSVVKTLRKGTTLRVKKVIFLGNKANQMTRFELSNGTYVTANKNFVNIVK